VFVADCSAVTHSDPHHSNTTGDSAQFLLIFTNNKTSNLSKARETCDSLSSSRSQIVLVYLQPFRRSSHWKWAPQPKIAKNTKTSNFGGSRSFRVIEVD